MFLVIEVTITNIKNYAIKLFNRNTCDFISLWTGDSEEQKSKTDINTKENVYRSVSFNQRLTFEKARTLFGSNSVG